VPDVPSLARPTNVSSAVPVASPVRRLTRPVAISVVTPVQVPVHCDVDAHVNRPVGGAAGATVRKGDLLATVDHSDVAVTITGRFIQFYRENAKWLERSYDFVPRIGLAELRAIVVEARDGIGGRLDEAMQHSIDAYRDPWQEHRQPATAGQFHDALPLVELPKVPVR